MELQLRARVNENSEEAAWGQGEGERGQATTNYSVRGLEVQATVRHGVPRPHWANAGVGGGVGAGA